MDISKGWHCHFVDNGNLEQQISSPPRPERSRVILGAKGNDVQSIRMQRNPLPFNRAPSRVFFSLENEDPSCVNYLDFTRYLRFCNSGTTSKEPDRNGDG